MHLIGVAARIGSMRCRRLLGFLALAAAAAADVAACGGSAAGPGTTTPAAAPDAARPGLLEAARAPGEIVVQGEASPASHGPFRFDGRYTVRFEQIAPEDPRLDFGGQTAFVAIADRRREQAAGDSVKLFRVAARTGRRRVTLRGSYYVDVSFGDFPYAIRFTPDGGR
jgi:hypothetical protein